MQYKIKKEQKKPPLSDKLDNPQVAFAQNI